MLLKEIKTGKFVNPIYAIMVLVERHRSGKDQDRERAIDLRGVTYETRSVRKDLKERAETLRDALDHLVKSIKREEEEGSHASINSLGEIQGMGPQLDILCALYCERRDHLTRFVAEIPEAKDLFKAEE